MEAHASKDLESASASFHTTHWSVVLRAGAPDQHSEALEELCQTYWPPLYAYLRREGHAPSEAEDIVQGFFERLLAQNSLRSVHPEKGRFRSFLLACLRNYSANFRRDSRTARRGGKILHLNFHDPIVSARCEAALQKDPRPELAFDRVWAETVMHHAAQRLRQEYSDAGKGEFYEIIRVWLAGEPRPGDYAATARSLNLSEGAVGVAVHRLRRRYREIVRAEVAHTVQSPAEVADEMRYLLQVLSSS